MSVLQTGVSARKCWVPTNNTQWTHHQLTVQTRQTRSVWEYTLTSPLREGRPWSSWPSARGQHVRERRKTLGWDKKKNLCVPQREVEKPRQEHSRKLGSIGSDSFRCYNHVPESWNANYVSIITSNCILNISTKYPTITSNSTYPKQDLSSCICCLSCTLYLGSLAPPFTWPGLWAVPFTPPPSVRLVP